MSSTEEDDSYLNVMVENPGGNATKENNKLDPETFTKRCNITCSDANDSTIEDAINNSCTSSQIVNKNDLQTRKARNQPQRTSIYEKFKHPCVPKINCPEKIIFCIDMSSEMEDIPFRKNDGSQHPALSMVKRTIELFVHNKNFIDKKHEFSLMVLYQSATWVREFTNDPMELIDSLEDLNETQPCDSCDLGSIVQLISEKFEMIMPINLMPVQYILRVILIYGRSSCMFHFSDEQLQDTLMRYPFLFLDILYIHEPPSENNQCKEIYDALCDLDEQNKSYIFEVTHNITKLHNCMAKFLSHPLQRNVQKDACYKIREVADSDGDKKDFLCDDLHKISLSV